MEKMHQRGTEVTEYGCRQKLWVNNLRNRSSYRRLESVFLRELCSAVVHLCAGLFALSLYHHPHALV